MHSNQHVQYINQPLLPGSRERYTHIGQARYPNQHDDHLERDQNFLNEIRGHS